MKKGRNKVLLTDIMVVYIENQKISQINDWNSWVNLEKSQDTKLKQSKFYFYIIAAKNLEKIVKNL